MLLVACQPKSEPKDNAEPDKVTASAVVTKPTLKGELVKLDIPLPECDGKSCPEFNVARLQSNFPFIDQWIDQKIVESLSQLLDVMDRDETQDLSASQEASAITPEQQLSQQIKPYVAAFLALDQELKTLGGNHQISVMVQPKVLENQGTLVTVVLNSSSYLGGAHGSTAQDYYNFDLKSEKRVTLNELLLPNQKAAFEKLVRAAYQKWVIDAKLANNVRDYEQAWPFKLTDNFYLAKNGLILQYGEYEIGPFAVGLPRLVIDYAQLREVLKPAYLPQPPQTEASQAMENSKP